MSLERIAEIAVKIVIRHIMLVLMEIVVRADVALEMPAEGNIEGLFL